MDFQKQKIEHSRLGGGGGWEDLPGRWKGNPGVKRVEQAQRTIPIDRAPGWQAPGAEMPSGASTTLLGLASLRCTETEQMNKSSHHFSSG